jgi:osmotically-inducible protein OsmY
MSRYSEEMRMIDRQRVWRDIRRPLATIILCGVVATTLQGCIEMAIGSAVMGTIAAGDRRTFGAQTEDKAIVLKGEGRISNLVGGVGHVNVASFNRKVLLTGEVRDEAMKTAVEREASNIEGVQSVVNELVIAPASSLSSRSGDSLITAKVKASFVDTRDLYANAIKVVTEQGVVYLMGRVAQREGVLAGEVARNVNGVQKVVKVFEYIDENEIKQVTNVPESQNKM